ncbi:MAG: cyclic nucleotide-binding domain-containing protein [Proteobacteria bacterium]|nr:cyclic nucleotide-binding domain-containing protein [Pseudomonadota bacterium]
MHVEGGGSKKRFLKQGEVLFREGDPGTAAYIVDSGRVGIFKIVEGEHVELAALNGGELFGEMAIVDGSKRMANAHALEDSVIIEIPAATVEGRLAKVDPFLRALMKILVNNLRSVHRSYMTRARSAKDYLAAIQYHAQGFRVFLIRQEETPTIKAALDRLDKIDALADQLRADADKFSDSRGSVLRDADLTRRNPDGV